MTYKILFLKYILQGTLNLNFNSSMIVLCSLESPIMLKVFFTSARIRFV